MVLHGINILQVIKSYESYNLNLWLLGTCYINDSRCPVSSPDTPNTINDRLQGQWLTFSGISWFKASVSAENPLHEFLTWHSYHQTVLDYWTYKMSSAEVNTLTHYHNTPMVHTGLSFPNFIWHCTICIRALILSGLHDGSIWECFVSGIWNFQWNHQPRFSLSYQKTLRRCR